MKVLPLFDRSSSQLSQTDRSAAEPSGGHSPKLMENPLPLREQIMVFTSGMERGNLQNVRVRWDVMGIVKVVLHLNVMRICTASRPAICHC